MGNNRGIVYILTNTLFKDNVIKIGSTTNIESRVENLSRETGVPCPFACYVAYEIDNYKKVEEIMHTIYRSVDKHADKQHKRKEFFLVSPADADNVLAKLACILNGKRVIFNNTKEEENIIKETKEELEKTQVAKKFKFNDYNIPMGAELFFSKDNNIRCTVLDNNKVQYNNEEYSLSRLTAKLMKELGYSSLYYNGYDYWLYNGQILSDYRNL